MPKKLDRPRGKTAEHCKVTQVVPGGKDKFDQNQQGTKLGEKGSQKG